jgi:hypothetical protein
MLWASQKPGGRQVCSVRVIIWLIPGGQGDFTDCCAYIAESGANFQKIVKGPVHGEKCVQNCALKNCNCLYFSTSAYILFVYFMHFDDLAF